MNKNLKKVLVTGASLVMFASVGLNVGNLSNASARHVRTHRAIKFNHKRHSHKINQHKRANKRSHKNMKKRKNSHKYNNGKPFLAEYNSNQYKDVRKNYRYYYKCME